jgi:hypothetical protein
MIITSQDADGNIEENGGFPSGGPYTHLWTMTGKVSGNVVELTIIYVKYFFPFIILVSAFL